VPPVYISNTLLFIENVIVCVNFYAKILKVFDITEFI
jgi:hypothetical protein